MTPPFSSSILFIGVTACSLIASSAWSPAVSRPSSALYSTPPKPPRDPICDAPGDPSMVLNLSVSLGDQKVPVMKAISSVMSSTLGKPESYVAVYVNDGQSMIWGGEETACAVGCMYSLGGINQENNGKIQKAVSELLKPHGVEDDRIYINYFDIARENCGWSSRTFAG